jgi:hypothetical protein
MSAQLRLLAITAAGLIFAGCASEPPPSQDVTRARTLIEQAEKAGAQRYAAVELESARDKLQQANAAQEDGEQELANERAAEAVADAELANALTLSGAARAAAEELQRGNDTLRQETERGLPGSSATPPVSTAPPITPPQTP